MSEQYINCDEYEKICIDAGITEQTMQDVLLDYLHDGELMWFSILPTSDLKNQPLNEVKVLVVGDGAAGKTSLVKRLLGLPFDHHEDTTHGINIKGWEQDFDSRRSKSTSGTLAAKLSSTPRTNSSFPSVAYISWYLMAARRSGPNTGSDISKLWRGLTRADRTQQAG